MTRRRSWFVPRTPPAEHRGWLRILPSVPRLRVMRARRRTLTAPAADAATSLRLPGIVAVAPASNPSHAIAVGAARSVCLDDGVESSPAVVAVAAVQPTRTAAPGSGGRHGRAGGVRHATGAFDAADGAMEAVLVNADWSSLRDALQLSTETLLRNPGPLAWPTPLLEYQIVGARQLIERPALLLADDMGLGKTIQAIAALRALIVAKRVACALIVAPAGLLRQWRDELQCWAPELRVSTVHGHAHDRDWQWRTPVHVYLTSYETLRSDFSTLPGAPVAREWDLVVLDEAQKIKNATADVSRVCKLLRRRRQWALTGTPLENSVDDIVSILDFVAPRAAQELHGFTTPANVKSELGLVQLRRRKADVLRDLPPKLISHVVLPMAPRQRATYERAEREGIISLRERGATIRIEHVLELILRLKQICNICPSSGQSSKLDDLRERVQVLVAEGQKALVFTQFANAENGARAIAARLGVPALTYTGEQAQDERARVLDKFRADPTQQALVLSLRAGGQGLNLQQASYVFHFDRWWNPAIEAQAESRSHRMGQQYPVNVYTYICEDTIEERIDAILREKRLLFDELVDDVSLDLSQQLTRAELFGLFGLPAPPAAGGV